MLITRRHFLIGAAATGAMATLPARAALAVTMPVRSLAFNNLHTGEKVAVTYCEHGQYLPDALEAINHVLRDHRNGEVAAMDIELLDLLSSLKRKLGVKEPFQVISGYRSPESNRAMKEAGRGVATHSMHMEGKAIDIRLKSRNTREIRNAALAMARGGVGYYPSSDFVHLDTGRVRKW